MFHLKGTEGGQTHSPGGLRCSEQECKGSDPNDLWPVSLEVHYLVTVWYSRSVTPDYPQIVYSSVQRASELLKNLTSNAESMIALEQLTLTCLLKRSWELDSPANMYLVVSCTWTCLMTASFKQMLGVWQEDGVWPIQSWPKYELSLFSAKTHLLWIILLLQVSILLFKFSHSIQ